MRKKNKKRKSGNTEEIQSKQKVPKKEEKKDETKQLNDVLAKVKSSDDNLTPYASERFLRFYKLYRSHIPKKEWPTKSKIFNPLVFSIIETQVAKQMAAKPIGDWKPANKKSGEDAKGDPYKIQLAFDDWWRKERAILKGQDGFKKTLMYGGASAQVYWKFQIGYKLGKPYNKADRPSIRILRMEDKMFGFDPEPDYFEDCKWAFVRYPISKKALEDIKKSPQVSLYKNLDKAINSFDGEGDDTYADKALMQERKDLTDTKNVNDETIKKVECIYIENYETGDYITIVGQKHIIMDRKNPYLSEKSLLLTSNIRVPSEIIGMSDIEPIESLQHGANLFRNQRADNVNDLLKPQWLVGDDAEIDDDELADEDSLVIHAKDINKAKQLPKENVTGTAYKEDETIKNDIYAATSVTPFSAGNDNDVDSEMSGRAIGKLQDAANARIKNKMMNFEIDYIKEVAEKWQRLMAQFQTENIVVDDNGEEVIITPEDLGSSEDGKYGEWSFHVESGSTQHVDDTQSREDYLAWQDTIIKLAELKKNDAVGDQPMVDPQTGQPLPPQPSTQVLDYDKMAEKLSEKFGQKDWRQVWIIEDENEMQPIEEDLLPPIEDEEMGEMEGGEMPVQQGEMLPSIDQSPQQMQQMPQQGQLGAQSGEMLPAIDEMQMPQSPEMQQEMLPPIEKQGFFKKLGGKVKNFIGEMLPPIN